VLIGIKVKKILEKNYVIILWWVRIGEVYNKLQDRAKEINDISIIKNKSIISYWKEIIVNIF